MTTRKFSQEEKKQLLANLDFEVEHRIRQLEEWLQDALQNFKLHQEGLISRIPRPVRAVSMAEFADKYDGDVQACLRGLQSARLGAGGDALSIDRDTRKRKWASAQEDADASGNVSADAGPSKAPKSARLAPVTPKKKVGLSTIHESGQKSRVFQKTPGATRTFGRPPPSPSPQKSTKKPPWTTATTAPRPASPFKHTHPSQPPSRTQHGQSSHPQPQLQPHSSSHRPPSTSTFAPTLPKAPIYPTLRAPRRDENMLSTNGSPLANPYTLGLGWFAGGAFDGPSDPDDTELLEGDDDDDDDAAMSPSEEHPQRTKSQAGTHGAPRPKSRALNKANGGGIVVRRDPSVTSLGSGSGSGSGSGTSSSGGSRNPSGALTTSSRTSDSSDGHPHHPRGPNGVTGAGAAHAHDAVPPRPPSAAAFLQSARALVALPTKDGHVLEFDPLTTGPRALDALAGITDSAKKQAKEEMVRLVQAAVSKWTLA